MEKKPETAEINVKPLIEYVDDRIKTVEKQINDVVTQTTARIDEKADKSALDTLNEKVESTPIPEGFVKETIKDSETDEEQDVIRPEKSLASEELLASSISDATTPLTEAIEKASVRLGLKEPEEGDDTKSVTEEFSETMNARDEQYRELLTQFEERVLEAVWDTTYINDLPDSAFAYIEKGGSKDDQGRTAPRSLRHLPFKNVDGVIDRIQLVNSLTLCETVEPLSAQARVVARRKLQGAVDAYNNANDDRIENVAKESLTGKPARTRAPLAFMPALVEHQGWRLQRLSEQLADANARLVKFEEFINEIIDPKGAKRRKIREGLDDQTDVGDDNPEQIRIKALRKLILKHPEQ